MITALNEDMKPFEEMVLSFVKGELKPHVEERDRYPFGHLDVEMIENPFHQIYELGFLGVLLPEKFGGIHQGISVLSLLISRIAEVDASYALLVFTHHMSQQIILEAGADKIAEKIYLQAKTAQDCIVAYPSFCNPGQIVMLPQAAASGNGYKLTGKMDCLVPGNFSHWTIIPAKIAGKKGYSFFLADLKDKNVTRSAPVFTLGLHACPIVDVTLDGVCAELIGEEGAGERYFGKASMLMYIAAAAISSGIMRGSFKDALAYARQREQGGRVILNWSEVKMIMANMAVKMKVADLCVAQCCQAIEGNVKDWGRTIIAASLHIHDLACELVTDGVQVLGGNGYMKDYGQEKRYRDARQVQALLGLAPLAKLSLIQPVISWRPGEAL